MTEWDASKYEQISGLQQAMAADALSFIHLNGRERVLDIGCGNGRITAAIADQLQSGNITGVDASQEMIAFARQHYASRNQMDLGTKIQFLSMDARQLPFEQQFDFVVSFNALHWIPNQDLALRSIRRAMTKTAQAQLRLVLRGGRKSLEDVLEETRHAPNWSGFFTDFHDPYLRLTLDEYVALARQQGFAVTRAKQQSKSWDFQSREAFHAFGSVTFVAWTSCLPEEQRSAYIEEVLDRYRAAVCDQTGEENTFKFYQMDISLQRT